MKRFFVLLGVLGVAAVVAYAAYGYFTASGSGIGGANVGTSTDIGLGADIRGQVYPGTALDVTFSALNEGGGPVQLGTIRLTDLKACPEGFLWDEAHGSTPARCYALDPYAIPWTAPEVTTCESFSGGAVNDTTKNFWMEPVAANQKIPVVTYTEHNEPIWTDVTVKGSLVMNDLDTSQDSCKNVQLWLKFTS